MITGRKLLLADDSLTIQKVISLTFSDEGMDVTTVSSGEQAMKKLEESMPDIILADVFMPEPNGYKICERIKTDERFRHIPVLLLVGTFEPFNKAEARRVGADDVLTKPFQSIRDLVSKVGNLLSGQPDEPTQDERDSHDHVVEDEGKKLAASAGVSSTRNDVKDANASNVAYPWEHTGAQAASETSANSFADLDMDDQTIQSVSADKFVAHTASPQSSAVADRNVAETSSRETSGKLFANAPTAASEPVVAAPAHVYEATASAQKTFATHLADAAAADDALLDLGEMEPASAASHVEADDFILDIDEPPAVQAVHTEDHSLRHTGQVAQVEPFVRESTSTESEKYEALHMAHTVAEPQEMRETADEREEAASARESESSSALEMRPSNVGQTGLAQLSPEAIDAIVRRVIEQMSARVVEQVAWEVVPDLAERLIKQHLDEKGIS